MRRRYRLWLGRRRGLGFRPAPALAVSRARHPAFIYTSTLRRDERRWTRQKRQRTVGIQAARPVRGR